jgi:hypothetical protein
VGMSVAYEYKASGKTLRFLDLIFSAYKGSSLDVRGWTFMSARILCAGFCGCRLLLLFCALE